MYPSLLRGSDKEEALGNTMQILTDKEREEPTLPEQIKDSSSL